MRLTQPLNITFSVKDGVLFCLVDGVKQAECPCPESGMSGKYPTYQDITQKQQSLLLEVFPDLKDKEFVSKELCHYPSGSSVQTYTYDSNNLLSAVRQSSFLRAVQLGLLILE